MIRLLETLYELREDGTIPLAILTMALSVAFALPAVAVVVVLDAIR